MKKKLTIMMAIVAAIAVTTAAAVTSKVYHEQGGARFVIANGGSLDVESGGQMDIESGGAIKLAGTALTPTAAQINVLAGVTAGTAKASSAAVLGATINLDQLVLGKMSLTPTDTVPASAEGNIYWDDSDNALKVYTGATWLALSAGSGDNTLDDAYDQGGGGAGRTITADTGAVTITNTDADAAFLLALTPTPGSSAAMGGMSITSGAFCTQDAIQISNAGSGDDIQGTGSTWKVTSAGAATVTDLTLGNGAAITNAVDGAVKITEGGEDISLTFNANTLTLTTASLMDSIAFGVVDDLKGVGSITFDAAAAGITLTADGTGDDLTISVAGATNSSLVLSSAGTEADAFQIITTAGGIDAVLASLNINADEDVADAITITASAGGIDITADGAAAKDLDLVCTNGSVNISGGEADAAAVTIAAGAGGVDITSASTFDIDITATGGKVLITGNEDAAGAVSLLTSGGGGSSETIIITNDQGDGDASINVDSTAGGLDVDVAKSLALGSSEAQIDAIQIQASAGGIDVDAANNIDIKVTSDGAGEDLLLTQVGGNDSSITLTAAGTGADAIGLVATAGGIAVSGANSTISIVNASDDATDDITLQVTGATNSSIVLDNVGGTGADAISLQASGTGGGIDVDTDDGAISIVADGAANGDITIDAADQITIVSTDADGTDSIYLHANGGASENIKIHSDQGTAATSVSVVSDVGGVTVSAAAGAGAGKFTILSALHVEATATAFAGADGTPDVSGHTYFTTGGADTYTDFDAGAGALTCGQIIIIKSAHGATFDTTGTGLVGSSQDIVTAAGDVTMWFYDGTDWICIQFTDVSADNSGGI